MDQHYVVDSQGYIVDVLNSGQPSSKEGTLVKYGWTKPLYTPRFSFDLNDWIEGKTEDELLHLKKEDKILEFNKKCEETIEAGFTASNGHSYKTTRDAQINMIGQKDELMTDDSILEVKWKTEDVGYVTHTRDEWLNIYKEALSHKKTQLFKYDDLKAQVNNCTTIEEVDSIAW